MLLKDKVALITGTSSGIGRATAQLFATHGAKVAGVDFNDAGGRETAESIRSNSGDSIFVHADIGKDNDIQNAIETAVKKYGRIDILHSNAASYAALPITETREEDWDRTVDICLKATYRLARGIVPIMHKTGGGVIVITGSVHGIRGYKGHTAYQASKGGLLALTRSLAADCAPQIRVNIILPGAVVTGIWKNTSEEKRKKIAQMCLLRRNSAPEEIAQVALFLASDMSSYMTGASIVVDGGLSAVIEPRWEE